MERECATVVIETKNGPVRINATDYDPKSQKLANAKKVEEPATPAPAPAPTPTAAPATPTVPPVPAVKPAVDAAGDNADKTVKAAIIKEGAKYYVVDMNNDNAKIADTDGYPSKVKATDAAQALQKD